MYDIKYNTFELPNIPLLKTELPIDIYNSVMSEIKEIERNGSTNTWNHELAGAIEREYLLTKSKSSLDSFLIDAAKKYPSPHLIARSGISPFKRRLVTEIEYEVGDIWVNYQQKNEYNPIHNHGGDLSFVIWMEIPFKHSDECNVKNVVNSNATQSAAVFEIVYNDILGSIRTFHLPVENGWEGRIIMFPAKLFHSVNPFQTSDGYRISISGNLGIKNLHYKQ